MRCRSEATEAKRCAVGQTVTMRCRFAVNPQTARGDPLAVGTVPNHVHPTAVPLNAEDFLPSGRLTDDDLPVLALKDIASRAQGVVPAIGTEGDPVDSTQDARRAAEQFPRAGVPDAHRFVGTGGDQEPAVG